MNGNNLIFDFFRYHNTFTTTLLPTFVSAPHDVWYCGLLYTAKSGGGIRCSRLFIKNSFIFLKEHHHGQNEKEFQRN